MESLVVARSEHDLAIIPKRANRHGLITGATGTGKTVSLQVMAEAFSRIGVPVFVSDVKGDFSGIGKAGGGNPKVAARAEMLGLKNFVHQAYPVVFWDLFGEQGHPVRTTVSEMGPLLLSRLLGLNEVQSGVINIVFEVADDNGLLLLDLKDLRAMLQHVSENSKSFSSQYGNVSAASVGAIQRALLSLEQQGGEQFFGEPALDLDDLMQTHSDGRGVVNVLAADKLMQAPKIYATFLMWLLSELFESLPEVGDPEKPRLVFFFDEAHLLFDDVPDALMEKIEQVVRLIRSKGVGVYFITQNPADVPDKVLGQLGHRVQHALRAFTPSDQKAVRAAAQTFRSNPALETEKVITELAIGEALVSFLDESGAPGIVQRAWVYPPQSHIGPLTADERRQVIQFSVLRGHYERMVDRESAYEKLKMKAESAAQMQPVPQAAGSRRAQKSTGGEVMEAFMKSAVRAVGSQMGRQLLRGVLGGILGGTAGRSRR